jgi:hypothetical protein
MKNALEQQRVFSSFFGPQSVLREAVHTYMRTITFVLLNSLGGLSAPIKTSLLIVGLNPLTNNIVPAANCATPNEFIFSLARFKASLASPLIHLPLTLEENSAPTPPLKSIATNDIPLPNSCSNHPHLFSIVMP